MTTQHSVDWAALLDPVARALLGEPNSRLSRPQSGVLRYGRHGSLVRAGAKESKLRSLARCGCYQQTS